MKLIKFLPSYVGSKAYWVPFLQSYKGKSFVELFAGSAVISANLAKDTILVDTDIVISMILGSFYKQKSKSPFTQEDYFKYRSSPEWIEWVYMLQSMSFSGVFRYSKNGYNVPVKKALKQARDSIIEELTIAKKRWYELAPTVYTRSYNKIDISLLKGKVVVLDPPYQGSQASYNTKFDYEEYWLYMESIKYFADTVILFDRKSNLVEQGIPVVAERKMRVNGARQGDTECMAIYSGGKYATKL